MTDEEIKKLKLVTSIIWRKSIFDRGFICACGQKLSDGKRGMPLGDVLLDTRTGYLYCPKCKWVVAKQVPYLANEKEIESGFGGEWKG